MYPVEGGHQVLLEATRYTAQQRLHKPGREGVPNIQDTKKWFQKRHIEPVADGETLMPGISLG